MARNSWPACRAVDDEIMALGLASDCLVNRSREQHVALRRTQWGTQNGSIVLAEAHEERSGAGDAHAVAAFAEIVGEGRNKAKSPAGLLHLHIAGGPAGLVRNVGQRKIA